MAEVVAAVKVMLSWFRMVKSRTPGSTAFALPNPDGQVVGENNLEHCHPLYDRQSATPAGLGIAAYVPSNQLHLVAATGPVPDFAASIQTAERYSCNRKGFTLPTIPSLHGSARAQVAIMSHDRQTIMEANRSLRNIKNVSAAQASTATTVVAGRHSVLTWHR
jgi:hypothetical protein